MTETHKIKEQMSKVFDEKQQVMPCGRNECMTLIQMFQERFPDVDFGNINTGIMNVKNILEYARKI